jgi:hypothetical protein
MQENLENKIRQAIGRLDQKPWREWNGAVILNIKTWLFPRMIAYMDGYREEDKQEKIIDEAKKIFEV